MSDYERGPYTPQTDAPLAFDARRSRGDGRRAFPMTLVVSLVILAVLVVAVVLFYRSGVRSAAEGPVAVGTPVGEIKAPAPPQAQSSDEATGLQIYKAEGGAAAPPAAPGFAPPPEEPRARPTPPVTAQPITTPPSAAPSTPPPAAIVAASGATSKPATAAASKPVATAAPRPAAAAAPKDEVAALLDKAPAAPSKAAAAKPPAAATSAPATKAEASPASGGAVAQIGAYSSEALAAKGWSDIAAAFAADMSGKGKHFEPVVAADGKTLYRATVTGFSSKADAQAFCAKLSAAKHACIAR